MEKLFAYMEKLGLDYQKETFGASYFHNAEKISFPGAYITLGPYAWDTSAWRQFEKYCKRWGYSLKAFGGHPGWTVYTVCRKADQDRLEHYHVFMNRALHSIEQEIHIRHTGGHAGKTDKEFNDYIRGIMDFYGEEYNTEQAPAFAGA